MEYLVFGICTVICAGTAVLAIRVWKENRKLGPKKKGQEEDESW